MDLAENQPLCCLCCLSVPLDHRRRKKFNGTGCMKSKATLEKISSTPLDFFVETSHPNAVLCSACEKLLINISKLEEKLQILKREVTGKLQGLTRKVPQLQAPRKRSIGQSESVPFDSAACQHRKRINSQTCESARVLNPSTTIASEVSVVESEEPQLLSDSTETGECATTTTSTGQTPTRTSPLLVSKKITQRQ